MLQAELVCKGSKHFLYLYAILTFWLRFNDSGTFSEWEDEVHGFPGGAQLVEVPSDLEEHDELDMVVVHVRIRLHLKHAQTPYKLTYIILR